MEQEKEAFELEEKDIAPQETPTEQPSGEPASKKEAKGEKNAKRAADAAAIKAKIEAMTKELQSAKEALLRTAAEYENFRKRSAKERDAAFGNGLGYAVEQLLPILDTLSLAANADTADESYKKGVLMTANKCQEAFEKLEVAEIEAQGMPFDPALCAAVLQQPAPEGIESGTVLQVLQKGYKHKDKVLRHATVVVAE